MTTFPVTYESESLLRAKFADALAPETLFHKELALLLNQLSADALIRAPTRDAPFAPDFLSGIAKALVDESWRSGWWAMSEEARIAYLQDIVAAPYTFSPQEIEDILEDVGRRLCWRRRVVSAADAAGEADKP